MTKKLSFETKEKMVSLAGACFWYWNGFYSFLSSCGVPKSLQTRYPQGTYTKYQVMRNILSDLEQAHDLETINSIASAFYRLRNAIDKDDLDEKKARKLLEEFRETLGDDPIESEVRRKEQEKARTAHRTTIAERQKEAQKLQDLNATFILLVRGDEMTAQARGYKLETLFFDLLHLNEYEFRKPYRTAQGEQIDGHFKHEKFDYLVEAKWTQELTTKDDLAIFDNKIKGKAQSTRGYCVSANGFDTNAVAKFSGDAPRILLMTGEDLALILGGQIQFFDAMNAKVDAIVRHGNILLPLRGVVTK